MPSPIPAHPEATHLASFHFVAYPGAIADTDLSAEGRGPCRRIRATAAGNLVVKRASDNTNVTLPMLAGESMDIQATSLVAASSTVVGCVVFW